MALIVQTGYMTHLMVKHVVILMGMEINTVTVIVILVEGVDYWVFREEVEIKFKSEAGGNIEK